MQHIYDLQDGSTRSLVKTERDSIAEKVEKQDEDKPVNVKTRVPVDFAEYLIGRAKERGSEYRTFRKLSQAIAQEALEEFPWERFPRSRFARPQVEVPDPRSVQQGFIQLNVFVLQSQKQRLMSKSERKGVSLGSLMLTIIFWWVLKDEERRKKDPEILNIMAMYWSMPSIPDTPGSTL